MNAPPLAFLMILTGAVLLDKGVPMARQAFEQQGTPSNLAGDSSAGQPFTGQLTNTALGPTTNPVPGASPGRLDEGIDGTAKAFLAPFEGTVVKARQSDPGWAGGGYVAIQSLVDPQWVYYAAEGIGPTVEVGQHVKPGDRIGIPVSNPYNGIVGNFEIGRANPSSPGQPLAQVTSDARGMVLAFYAWFRGLGGPATTNPSNAGSA